jgi:hypothetical protein
VVWPRGGDLADYSEAWQDYFNVVSAATAVFGLNTTALLEAVVAGRPCITLLSEEYRMAQTATGHFRHLLAGDFMELARNYDEIADAILKIRAGVDVKAQQRRQFRTSFLRPCGPETPASIVVVELLESLARPAPAERLSWSQLRPSRQLPDPMPGLVVSA